AALSSRIIVAFMAFSAAGRFSTSQVTRSSRRSSIVSYWGRGSGSMAFLEGTGGRSRDGHGVGRRADPTPQVQRRRHEQERPPAGRGAVRGEVVEGEQLADREAEQGDQP